MGAWGAALFSDDVACDVRQEFLNLLRIGSTPDEAVEVLKNDWADSIADADNAPVFWFALAATAWAYGCLNDEVKRSAVDAIDSEADLARWSGSGLQQRRRVLATLRAQLLLPQPKTKRPRRVKPLEPTPSHEVAAPDGLGKAVAFSLPGAGFMQVYMERNVGDSVGGGSIFVAECRYDEVDLEWLPSGALQLSYPESAKVDQKSDSHFYCGEVIPIVYRTKPA